MSATFKFALRIHLSLSDFLFVVFFPGKVETETRNPEDCSDES